MLSWVSNGLLGLLGVDLSNKGNDSLSTEELRSVVRESGSDLPSIARVCCWAFSTWNE